MTDATAQPTGDTSATSPTGQTAANRGGKPSKGTPKDKRKTGNGGKKPGPKAKGSK